MTRRNHLHGGFGLPANGLLAGCFVRIIFQRHPESYAGIVAADPASRPTFSSNFPVFVYFSLTTLSTIGFGDITPITLQARYAAVAEGITGQFYLAILVARLVGMQMTQSPTQHAEQEAIESGTEKK